MNEDLSLLTPVIMRPEYQRETGLNQLFTQRVSLIRDPESPLGEEAGIWIRSTFGNRLKQKSR